MNTTYEFTFRYEIDTRYSDELFNIVSDDVAQKIKKSEKEKMYRFENLTFEDVVDTVCKLIKNFYNVRQREIENYNEILFSQYYFMLMSEETGEIVSEHCEIVD